MKNRGTFSFGKAKIPKVEVYRDDEPQIEVFKEEYDSLKSKPVLSRRNRKRICILLFGLAIILIVCLSIYIALSKSPIDDHTNLFLKADEYDEFLVRKIYGDDVNLIISQLNSSCEKSDEKSAFVSILNSRLTNSTVASVNSNDGILLCEYKMKLVSQNQVQLNENTLLASVNGESVYGAEVLNILRSLPESQRTEENLKSALDQVINNLLLKQDAKKRNIVADSKEIELEFNSFLAASGLTLQALEQNLKQGGISLQDFQIEVENRIVMQKLVAEITKNAQIPSEKEIMDYYELNKNNITSLGKSTTRQLLVSANASNAEEKLIAMQGLASMLNSTNFCDLVAKYSDDVQTKNSCGLYETNQGQLLPEYEQEVFLSKPGDVKIIPSRAGYHLVQVLRVEAPKQATFEEAKEGIKEYLTNLNRQQVLTSYLSNLKKDANIVYN